MDAYIGFYILRFRNKGKSVHSTALQKGLLNDSTEHGQTPPSECLGIMCKLQSRGKSWQLQPGRQESLRRGSGDAPSPRAAVQQGGCNTLTFGCLPRAPGTGQVASSFKVLEQLGNLHSTSLLCVAVTCYCQLGRNYELKTP